MTSNQIKASGAVPAKNLAKGLAILNMVAAESGGLTLAEISRLGDVPKPTAHRIIGVLLDHGMLRTDSRDRYLPGPQCLVLGNRFLDGLDLRREAHDVLRELTEETLETSHLGIREGTRIVYIEKVDSPHPVRMYSRVGATNPVHSTALGRAILAYCDAAAVEDVISAGLDRRTPNTTTDPERFRAKLAEIKRRGLALDDIENEEGIRCVAAPVFDHNGDAVAGISVSGPEQRLTLKRLEELATNVRRSAFALSERIGYSTDDQRIPRSKDGRA
jgi:IclR family acetate operon transcriptional repressor